MDSNLAIKLRGRIQIVRGPLAGMTGQVVSMSDDQQWLIQADLDGLLLRVSPRALIGLPMVQTS